MSPLLVIEQSLNGLQLGLMLFMIAAGMTLMLGIMNVVNSGLRRALHAGRILRSDAPMVDRIVFLLRSSARCLATAAVGVLMERPTFRHLYRRSYLDQVLCTIGLNMFLNELVRVIWGPRPLHMGLPPALAGTVELLPGLSYPILRLAIIAVGIVICIGLYAADRAYQDRHPYPRRRL